MAKLHRLKRRDFIAAVGGAAVWPIVARGQQPDKLRRIGLLWPSASLPPPPRLESFAQGLSLSGFVQDRNVQIELRYGPGELKPLTELASQLVQLNVEAIAAFGDLAPKAAQQATKTIPIVALSDDILGAGLVSSLSRPPANITGLTIMSPELSAKRLEVLAELLPGISSVAAIWDPSTGLSQVALTQNAARKLNITLQVLEIRRRDNVSEAFQTTREGGAQALNVFASPFLSSISQDILSAAARVQLPAIYQWREHTEAGGLMSYGPSLAALWRHSAIIVVKLLNGATPADLPIEQPTKFEMILNANTARSLSLMIPATVLLRADHIIE